VLTNASELARELSPAIEPARDLWPQIEARSTPSAAPRRRRAPRERAPCHRGGSRRAVVASVAVGVGSAESAAGGPSGRSVPDQPSRATFADAPTALHVAYVPDPRYQRDRAALMKTLQARLAALPPPARAKVMASLAAIQRAKQDLQNALGKDRAMRCCRSCCQHYQDEMRVLTDVHEASDPGRGSDMAFPGGGRDHRAVCERGACASAIDLRAPGAGAGSRRGGHFQRQRHGRRDRLGPPE